MAFMRFNACLDVCLEMTLGAINPSHVHNYMLGGLVLCHAG